MKEVVFITILALPAFAGCAIDFEYLLPVIGGQVDILLNAIPLDQAISNGNLTELERAKLELVRDVREYAGREMGLNTADNFTLFYDGGGKPIAYNISASHKFEFHAKKWEFPIVGVVPYLGFFDEYSARIKMRELQADDYDVFMYEIDAYSTLDFFPNPILSTMLRRNDLSLIDTVIHELLHNTLWHATDITFNESLATFVGRTGALEYIAARFPDLPDDVQAAIDYYEDTDLYNEFIFELYNELAAFFANGGSREERIAGREAYYQAGRERFVAEYQPRMNVPENYDWVADLPANNAWMLANYRYNADLDVFQQVYDATDRNWSGVLGVFRSASAAPNPTAYLRQWLADRPPPGQTSTEQSAKTAAPMGTDSHNPSMEGLHPRGLCPRVTCVIAP